MEMFGTLKRAVDAPRSILHSFKLLLACLLVPWSAATAQAPPEPKTTDAAA
jgi:hypothetical protein